MTRPGRWLARHVAVRGLALLTLGFISILLGTSYIDPEPTATVIHAMSWFTNWWPLAWCGWVFIGSGIIALLHAFRGQDHDGPGFITIVSVFLGWAVAYVISWLKGYSSRGWVTAALFACVAVLSYCCGRLVDITNAEVRPRSGEGEDPI